jgi:glycosyltransferase involved in cell wall biosynthesis
MTSGVAKATQPRPNAREFAPMGLEPLSDHPLVSVLIPSYNYGRYIGITLQSLLDQTYPNFEAIVCDDGSSDDSVEVIQRYAEQDARIKFFAKEHAGIVSTTNMAYANSKGEIISLLDSDDVFRPSKLEKVVAAFRNNPRSGVFMNAVQPVTAEGRPFGQPIPRAMDQGWLAPVALRRGGMSSHPPGPGLSFRREAVSEIFPLPSTIEFSLDAYLVGCAQFITEVSATTERLTDYRLHGANTLGLAVTDPLRMKRHVDDLEGLFVGQKDFIQRLYGPEVAQVARLEDVWRYWWGLLIYRALEGKKAGRLRPLSDEEMIGHVAEAQQRRRWRFILKLPDPLAKQAYSLWAALWFGSSAWQRAVKAIFRRWT